MITTTSIDGVAVYGDKRNAPYILSNMLAAYDNLPAETRALVARDEIKATHVYVKFLPETYEELQTLLLDEELLLFQSPLDRDIIGD